MKSDPCKSTRDSPMPVPEDRNQTTVRKIKTQPSKIPRRVSLDFKVTKVTTLRSHPSNKTAQPQPHARSCPEKPERARSPSAPGISPPRQSQTPLRFLPCQHDARRLGRPFPPAKAMPTLLKVDTTAGRPKFMDIQKFRITSIPIHWRVIKNRKVSSFEKNRTRF